MASDYKLAIKIAGELDGSLVAAVNGAQSMLDQLNGGKGTGKTIAKGMFSGLASAAKAAAKGSLASLSLIGAGSAAAAKAATDVGMDFESAMSDLAGTAGIAKTSQEFAQLEEAARNVGATTNKTSTEAAAALKYMALAGWDTNDSVQALSDMVKLSSASGTDLATTSDLVTDSMGALGLTMNDYAGYMDMVAAADSSANYSASEFMETMIGAGGSARMLGINLNELGTAAGILANNGTKGSEAGTKLNSIFARMAGQSKPVVDALNELGVSISDDQGNFLSFEDMLGNIKTGLEGIGDESERAAIMKDLFGTHNLSEAQYLLDSIGEGGAWDSLSSNLENAQQGVDEFGNAFDTLDERYSTATDNLQGDLDIMKSAASDFGIDIYKSIVGEEGGGLRGAVQEVTTIIGELKTAFQTDGLSGLADAIGTEISKISEKIAESGPQAIQDATQFATDIINSIGSEEHAAEIGGAAAAIITSLGTGFLTYTDDFVIAAGNIIQGLVDGFNNENTAEQWTSAASEMITNIGTAFTENAEGFGSAAGELITSLVTGIATHSGDILVAGIDILEGLGKGLISAVPILIGQLPTIVANLANGFLEAVPRFITAGAALGVAVIKGIRDSLVGLKDNIVDLIDSFTDEDFGTGTQYYADNEAAIQSLTQARLDGNTQISESEREIVQTLIDGGQEAYAALQEAMSGMDPDAQQEAAEASMLYSQYISEASQELKDNPELLQQMAEETANVTEATEGQKDAIDEMLESTQAAVTEGLDGTSDAATSMEEAFASVKEEAAGAGTAIQESLNTDLSSSMNADALSMLLQSIDTGSIDTVVAQLNTSMEQIRTTVDTASTGAQTSMQTAMTGIQTAVSTASMAVSLNMSMMAMAVSTQGMLAVFSANMTAAGITGAFSGMDLYSLAASAMDGLINGINERGAAAVAAAQSIASQIAGAMAGALQIHSPSRVTYAIGENVGLGLENALYDQRQGVYSASQALANNVAMGTNDSLSAPLRAFNSPAGMGAESSADAAGGNVGGITFSPQIIIQGNASENDVKNALGWSMSELEKMIDRIMANKRRTAFA